MKTFTTLTVSFLSSTSKTKTQAPSIGMVLTVWIWYLIAEPMFRGPFLYSTVPESHQQKYRNRWDSRKTGFLVRSVIVASFVPNFFVPSVE